MLLQDLIGAFENNNSVFKKLVHIANLLIKKRD